MRCTHTKPNGTRCRATTRPGKTRCAFHDPELAGERAEGRRRGGAVRSGALAPLTLPPDTPDLPLRTVADVTAALAEAYNLVRTGRVAVNVGNCLGFLAGVLLKAIEVGELEGRVAELEEQGRLRVVQRGAG